jgi:hypothetical protein
MRYCFRFEPGFLVDSGKFVVRENLKGRCVSANGKRRVALRDQVSGRIWVSPGGIHSDLLDEAMRDLGRAVRRSLHARKSLCTGTGRSPSSSPLVEPGTLSGRPEATIKRVQALRGRARGLTLSNCRNSKVSADSWVRVLREKRVG